MVLIYTTCRDIEEARKISKLIITKRLAGSINIWPIESAYSSKDEVKEEKEIGVLIKTTEAKVQNIEDLISENHTYSPPFIGTIDVRRVNRSYKEWMATFM